MNRDIKLAKLFLHCRISAHLSQYQLADLMGVKQMTIHRWEHGISKPYKKNWIRLLKIYNEILKNEQSGLSLRDNDQPAGPESDNTKSNMSVTQDYINELLLVQKQLDQATENYLKAE